MHALRLSPILLATALAACGGGASAPGGAAPSPVLTTGTPAAGAPTFSFAYRDGSYGFETRSDVTIAVKGDTMGRQEPVTTTLVATYTLTGGGAAPAVRGVVESFVVSSGGRVRSTPEAVAVPVAFEGVVGGTLRAAPSPGDTAGPCGTPNGAVLAAAARTLVPVPPTLARGLEWGDTLRTTVCRGDIPIVTVTASQYRVAGTARIGGIEAVQVRRAITMTVAGNGMSRGRAVGISGTGTGSSDLYFDSAAGRLLESTGESMTELTVDAAGVRQTLVQRERTVTKGRT